MSIRIIGGELGGRRIRVPTGRATRPTREVVRESWFNALAGRIPGSRVLDLFAGSGALGIEALSRGAASVLCVESNRRTVRVLRGNLSRLGIESRVEVRTGDALLLAESLARAERRVWDIVLADPPYSGDGAIRLVRAFSQFPFADILCVEHAPGLEFAGVPDWQRTYGDTALSFFVGPVDPEEGDSCHE